MYIADEDGIYSLKFDVPKAGKYFVHVRWVGEHIPDSPFKLKVHPGPNAGAVKAYGLGLEPSFEVEEVGAFTIETKKTRRNRYSHHPSARRKRSIQNYR